MENKDYNRLIEENKIKHLLRIPTVDLVKYKYQGRYLLEYLLENNIHYFSMDLNACHEIKWMKLYIKYNILEPLLKVNLPFLLERDGKGLVLDTLLKVFNDDQKLKLYQSMKVYNYWLFMCNEDIIIKTYKKYKINLPELFIPIPTLHNEVISNNSKLENLLKEFKKVYKSMDNYTLDVCINEFRRKAKIDLNRTCNDIKLLIAFKKNNRTFKIITKNLTCEDVEEVGNYNCTRNLIEIDNYHRGTFDHELSHMIYHIYERYLQLYPGTNNSFYYQYKTIQTNIKNNKLDNIITYIHDFHNRYNDICNYFTDLYFAKVEKKYGSYAKYKEAIDNDILENKLYLVEYSKDGDYIDVVDEYDNPKKSLRKTATEELIISHSAEYVYYSAKNYYNEELFLENLLDALLDGAIFDQKYGLDSLSGHGLDYFIQLSDLSFNEVLANYDAIIHSYQRDRLTNKLRDIVGDELVDLLDKYFNERKNKIKEYIKKEGR
jgi:hypothetical protein